MQNVSQRCEVKVAKYHFIIMWRFGVIEEKLQGGGGIAPPPSGVDRINPSQFFGQEKEHIRYSADIRAMDH